MTDDWEDVEVSRGLIPGIKVWQKISARNLVEARALLKQSRKSLGKEASFIESVIDSIERKPAHDVDVIVPERSKPMIPKSSAQDLGHAREVYVHLDAKTDREDHRLAALTAFSSIQDIHLRERVLCRVITTYMRDLHGSTAGMGADDTLHERRYALTMDFLRAHNRLKDPASEQSIKRPAVEHTKPSEQERALASKIFTYLRSNKNTKKNIEAALRAFEKIQNPYFRARVLSSVMVAPIPHLRGTVSGQIHIDPPHAARHALNVRFLEAHNRLNVAVIKAQRDS